VLQAPDERQFVELLRRVDRLLFVLGESAAPLPLERRKMQIHTDWRRDE
jgi:hypothetical protein